MRARVHSYKTTSGSSILCLSQIRVEANILCCKAFLHASGLSCSMAFFWVFHPTAGSPFPPAQLSDNHPLGEALATWPNKYHWFKRVISPEKTDFESHLLVKLQSFLKFSTIFFWKCIKAPTEKCTFSTTTNIPDFVICIVWDLVFIYFRDSTYNFRLWNLVLDYITVN